MGKRSFNAVNRVVEQIDAGRVLKAHNALDHEDTTVGPYVQAVDIGMRFAVIGIRGKRSQSEHRSARDAAQTFVDRVGDGRAREAALESERRHGPVGTHIENNGPQR